MTSDDLKRAMRQVRLIVKRRKQLAEAEADAIETALRSGGQQLDVAEAAERSREHIRRIAKLRGIPSRYPPRTRTDTEHPATDQP